MKKSYLLGLCGLLAIGAFSCKDDAIVDTTGPDAATSGETGYLAFSIKSSDVSSMTRGDEWLDDDNKDYDAGSEDEYKITANPQSNHAFFFKADGSYHSFSQLSEGAVITPGNVNDGGNHTTAYPERGFTAVVSRQGVNPDTTDPTVEWPAYCVLVLNAHPDILNKIKQETDMTLNKLLQRVSEKTQNAAWYKDGGVTYFTMSNSAYLDDYVGGNLGGTGKMKTATELTKNNFYTTEEEARKNAVTVYVERVAAKVSVTFKEEELSEKNSNHTFEFTGDDSDKYAGYSVLVTGWGFTGEEYQTYLVKNFKDQKFNDAVTPAAPTVSYLDYAESISFPSIFDGWNDLLHHRSYWAVDKNYSDKKYPTQYRREVNLPGNPVDEDRSVEYGQANNNFGSWAYNDYDDEEKTYLNYMTEGYEKYFSLTYNSFETINQNPSGHKYLLENTAESKDNLAMFTHIIINARLLAKGETATDLDGISDKYGYGGQIFTEKQFMENSWNQLFKTLKEFASETTVTLLGLVDKDEAGKTFELPVINGDFYIQKDGESNYIKLTSKGEDGITRLLEDIVKGEDFSKYFTTAPAYVLHGDGKKTIALAKDYTLYYAQPDEENEGFNHYIPFDEEQLLALIYNYSYIGDHYNKGMMYYALPIEHYKKNADSKDAAAIIGDYGVVRNHWYKYNVTAVAAPGTSVSNPDQPIVPNYDDHDRHIAYQVIILPWHIVNNGDITLGK